MIDVVQISKNVLARFDTMGYENNSLISSGKLIFPSKNGVKRISEQELRQLFIEEFITESNNFYYSIETPTVNRYSFTNTSGLIKIADDVNQGQLALIDMCVFEKEQKSYKRILNIEFKHKNATHNNISKDILKLMHEEQNGAFIILLKNTNKGSLNNSGEERLGVIDKIIKYLKYHHGEQVLWNGGAKKFIEIVILSLEENEKKKEKPFLTHCKIFKSDLETLNNCKDKWKKERI